MMPRARCVIRYLYRSARVAGVEPARIANGEKAAATRLETRRSRDPPAPAMPETNALCGARAKEMRYAEQGPRGEQPINNLDLRAGGERAERRVGSSTSLIHRSLWCIDSLPAAYRLPADAR